MRMGEFVEFYDISESKATARMTWLPRVEAARGAAWLPGLPDTQHLGVSLIGGNKRDTVGERENVAGGIRVRAPVCGGTKEYEKPTLLERNPHAWDHCTAEFWGVIWGTKFLIRHESRIWQLGPYAALP